MPSGNTLDEEKERTSLYQRFDAGGNGLSVGETKALLLNTLKLDSLDDFAQAVELAFSLTAKHYKVKTLSVYHSQTLFTVLKLFFAM